jgi:hypothetical protein
MYSLYIVIAVCIFLVFISIASYVLLGSVVVEIVPDVL